MNILDNFESLLFCFYTFCVRRPDPDPGWFSESRTFMERLTPKV